MSTCGELEVVAHSSTCTPPSSPPHVTAAPCIVTLLSHKPDLAVSPVLKKQSRANSEQKINGTSSSRKSGYIYIDYAINGTAYENQRHASEPQQKRFHLFV